MRDLQEQNTVLGSAGEGAVPRRLHPLQLQMRGQCHLFHFARSCVGKTRKVCLEVTYSVFTGRLEGSPEQLAGFFFRHKGLRKQGSRAGGRGREHWPTGSAPLLPGVLRGQPRFRSLQNGPDALPAAAHSSATTPGALGNARRRFWLSQLRKGLLLTSGRWGPGMLLNI